MKVEENRSFWMYVLLTVLTCGIYGIYFFYKMVADENVILAGDGEESPNYIVVVLLGLVTCGIYNYYWLYKQGNRIQRGARERYGINFDESGTTLLLWYLVGALLCGIGPMVANYFFIKNMNTISVAYNQSQGGSGYNDTYNSQYNDTGYNQYNDTNYNQNGNNDYNQSSNQNNNPYNDGQNQ